MIKYNVRLIEQYNDDIEYILKSKDIRIRHIDKVLSDFIIVEVNDKYTLSQLKFIKSIKETRTGRLLDVPRNKQPYKMKATTAPDIDLDLLKNIGLYGIGSKIAVIDSGHDIEKCGEVEKAMNFTQHPNYYDTCGHVS
ncbi:hypothetical protein J2T56_002521 [Natronobacillus azotifigens]|uniref:Peptidase S8/S53 domain-containing protein n=1 Tax=Natronobacillus azotifigens TaxID=472978 RepID=A0A9J6RFL8_9BACI|nr:hypothetical protein [Natronobacillus azotifigens]MCZ0704221.1 hypothetical protein [Natronobacillus azotifigens]